MNIVKGQLVKVVGTGTKTFRTPVRYLGRTAVVLKKSRNGICEVEFPEAHRITPLAIPVSQLIAL
jgi:hypothetical protein